MEKRRSKVKRPTFCGKANIAGLNIRKYRKAMLPKMSQNALAAQMQLEGIPINKNSIQQIEAGLCSVTDIQLRAFAKVLHISYDQILDESIYDELGYSDSQKDDGNKKIAVKTPDYKIDYKEVP